MLKLLLSLAIVGITAAQIGDVFVDISSGTVKGQSFLLPEIIPGNKLINRFHGIPYATPPVGDLRFSPPQPADPWDDVFIADTLPDACPQNFGTLALTHPFWTRFSEDCLYINVFAPNDTSGAPYPVMVYLHGGGYTGSANIQYPGHFQAGYDVVVAVPNYRLGALGFISTGDDVAQGNWGFMDQVLALQWVQENIAAFGGDPNMVTLYGQSAGASSIGLHMVSPYSDGLFHQAVFESGNELTVWAILGEGHGPENYTKEVAEKVGCPTTDSLTIIECLRTIDADVLIDTGYTCTPGYYCQGFAPVIDGDFIPMSPFDAREQGLVANVPIMTGICREDGSPYTLSLVPEAGEGGFTRSEFLDVMRNDLVSIFAPLFPDEEEDAFQALAYFYSPWPHIYSENFNRGMLNNATTDFGFGIAMDLQVKYHQEINENIYMYIMGYRTKHWSADILYPPWMGVPHNGELPYVIGFPFFQESLELRQDARIVDVVRWDEEDQIWSLYMMEMWTNFAKFGNPTPDPVRAPDISDTTWPIWNNVTQRYLYLDRHMEYRLEYRQRNFALWTEYLNYVTGINYGPDFQSGIPSSKVKQSTKKLNSKAMESMYKKFFAPKIAELVGAEIPTAYKTTPVKTQTAVKKSVDKLRRLKTKSHKPHEA